MPTFSKDVAPILYAQCVSCHRPGEAAPFSLLDYDEVRKRATQIAGITRRRVMPPWLPEPGYGAFAAERRLRDDQIDTIQRWVANGSPQGNPADKPAAPQWSDGWQLGTPDLVLKLQEPYTLQPSGRDFFRSFIIPVPLERTRYVKALEFRPGNPRILHHASVGADRTRYARTLDRADPAPGFTAMPEDQIQNMFGWTPGRTPAPEPPDLAWPLNTGSDLVVQLHMLPTGKSETIQPLVGLFFTDTPPTRSPLVIALESKTIDIPAGQPDYVVEDRYVLPADVDLFTVYPHAHYLAKEMSCTATLPDGSVKPLLLIKSWNFSWQEQYRYAEPLFLPGGTTVSMRFTYDNSANNPRNPHQPPQRVAWGPLSSDEMASLWLQIRPRRDSDASLFMRDYVQRSLVADIAGAELQTRLHHDTAAPYNQLATMYIRGARLDEAVAALESALRIKPDSAEALGNLGSVRQMQGRIPEAVDILRRAVAINANDDRLRFNLGNALHASGRTDDAIRELRRAVQINPENGDAHFNLAVILGPRRQLSEAVGHLRRAIEINPQHVEAHRNLAVALGMSGQFEEGLKEARTALEIRPDSAETRQVLALLQRNAAR